MIKPPKEPHPFDINHSAIAVADGTRIIAVSDLHIGVIHRVEHGGGEKNTYSDEDIINSLHAMAKEADHLVLNGDIFEMIYDRFGDKKQMRSYAQEVMESLISTCKEQDCHLHYVNGNHDDGNKLILMLKELEGKPEHEENFSVHPVALRIGPVFFTHGDLVLRAGKEGISINERIPSREKHIGDNFTGFMHGENQTHDIEKESTFSRIAHSLEARMSAQGALRIIQLMEDIQMPNQFTAGLIWKKLVEANKENPSLLDAITKEDGSSLPPVTRVSTGHTHKPYTNMMLGYKDMAKLDAKHCDVDLDNTGTPLTGKASGRYNPLRYTAQGSYVSVENLKVELNENQEVSITPHHHTSRSR